ncbi:MAG: zinc ribbon domain-containing protein [Oculatellaceae cyanobacterium bins.114]|nr:zinc ribbon domain-containing protein [Oculatellaceae cyanobacterium bins.114]
MIGLPERPQPDQAIELIYCNNCGAKNATTNRFCPDCGTKL